MTLLEVILECLGKVKAKDILVYDTKERSPFYDNMVLCTVDSERQAPAVISYIKEDTYLNGYDVRSVDGAETPWVVVDCNEVIVSIFTNAEREHFNLEEVYKNVQSRKID